MNAACAMHVNALMALAQFLALCSAGAAGALFWIIYERLRAR